MLHNCFKCLCPCGNRGWEKEECCGGVTCTTGQNESPGDQEGIASLASCEQWAGMVSECSVTCQVLFCTEQKGGGNYLDSFVCLSPPLAPLFLGMELIIHHQNQAFLCWTTPDSQQEPTSSCGTAQGAVRQRSRIKRFALDVKVL